MGRGKRRRIEPTDDWELLLLLFSWPEQWNYEKPHPEAYRRVLRTLGDEVEAVRRVVRAGREEVGVPELSVSHGW